MAGLAFARGGYFPRAWGIGVALLSAVVGLGLYRASPINRLERAFALGFVALLALVGISLNWTSSVTVTMLELERTALYAVLVVALVLIARRAEELVDGLVAAMAVVTAWALFEHLLLERDVDVYQGALLTGTLGYANALGAMTAIGSVAAASLGAESRKRWYYVGVAQLLLAATALTNSRGALLAWLLGAVVAVSLSRARSRLALNLAIMALLSLAVGLAAAKWGVTRGRVASPDVVGESRVSFVLVVGSAAAAALFARTLPVRPDRVGPRTTRAVLAVAVAAITVGFAVVVSNLGDRREYWHVAVEAFAEKPILGHGPGTYERLWLERRPVLREARDAHSLYLETFAEQGIVGGLLVAAILAIPLVALTRRRGAVVAAAGGGYAAFLAHAGLDWDWEMPAVTAAGLVVAVACTKLARDEAKEPVLGATRIAAAVVLTVVLAGSAVALAGNWRVTNARDQLAAGRPASALLSATRADSLQPWSSEPLVLSAESRLLLGDQRGAHSQLVEAVARDPTVWLGWWLLALTSESVEERTLATQQARRLNPLFGAP